MNFHGVQGSGVGIALLLRCCPEKKLYSIPAGCYFIYFHRFPGHLMRFHRFTLISGVGGWHRIVAAMLPLKKTLLTSSWLLSSVHRFIPAGCHHRFIDSPSSDLAVVLAGWARMGWAGLAGCMAGSAGWAGWLACCLVGWLLAAGWEDDEEVVFHAIPSGLTLWRGRRIGRRWYVVGSR